MTPTDWKSRESAFLAPWAMHAADSAGRVHPEPAHPFRSPYQRDRDRIVHSAAFRRLAHKTQVFTGYHGDYHRSRLTHTLEVTSIARTLARTLGLNEDLVEALALGHDIGHPPLGHAGEDTLDDLLRAESRCSLAAEVMPVAESGVALGGRRRGEVDVDAVVVREEPVFDLAEDGEVFTTAHERESTGHDATLGEARGAGRRSCYSPFLPSSKASLIWFQ